VSSLDGLTVVLNCGDTDTPGELAALAGVRCPARPSGADVDALPGPLRRVAVVGDDADLAAVLTRLLHTERLDVELAHVPARPTPGTRVWGLPHGPEAARLALHGDAQASTLVRDDHGGVLVGAGVLRGAGGAPLSGEAYADDTQVFSGSVAELRVRPSSDGPGVQVVAVRVPRLRRLLRRSAGERLAAPERVRSGAATGRALQLGSTGCEVVRDGVELGRVVPRWAFYRHPDPWLLVRPGTGSGPFG